ncbi:cell envelope integrity protein TolA [Vibrio ostreicida]|uniref:Cell envelope integrity protein TolA n=1 Tax=Vibrio ostreicida TaxID=526588 RepID=A0ABT8BTD0_9VIBR|nr:cell envelope integrity protein TolA [Vibrio ostreicida]MDN3609629.1 cell envelope integrity protein TolA [Vibrio ostreicida]NPD08500.1 cell envelope integrity protein TolA [Vibrio ostreicida]
MEENKPKKKSDSIKPMALSVALHLLLVMALIWGTDFTMSKPEPSGQMVQAVVIDPTLVREQAQQIRSQRAAAAKKEQDRLDKLRRESEQLEKNRKAEEERIRQLKAQQVREAKAAREAEKARQQKQKERQMEEERARVEKQRAAELEKERKAKQAAVEKAEQQRVAREKAAQEAQEKANREREAAKKAEQQRIAKEKAAKDAAEKARKEQERLKRLEKERKEQEAALDNIFSGLESESEQNSSARGKFINDEAQRFGQIYIQLIQQNLLLEDSFRGKSCQVNLRLIPTGTDAILGELKVLGGDNRLCAAASRAVANVGFFPMPKEQDVVNKVKSINLTVEPSK